jgi:hypothetical protein
MLLEFMLCKSLGVISKQIELKNSYVIHLHTFGLLVDVAKKRPLELKIRFYCSLEIG